MVKETLGDRLRMLVSSYKTGEFILEWWSNITLITLDLARSGETRLVLNLVLYDDMTRNLIDSTIRMDGLSTKWSGPLTMEGELESSWDFYAPDNLDSKLEPNIWQLTIFW